MNPNAPLSGPKFTTSDIEWRYYTHQATPTRANHDQEVLCDAAAARQSASRETVDTDYNEYNLTTGSTARKPCIETKQGTLIDFLD